MDKSQLRRLALDHARGRMSRDEYRERRNALVDDIASGRTPIERETPVADLDVTQPSAVIPGEPRLPEVEDAAASETRAALSPLNMGIGAALLVLLVIGAVWIFAGGEAPPPATTTVVAVPPAPAVSPARALVERFVAEKDFSERNLNAFQREWGGLGATDIEEARGEPWFRRLVTSVVQEVKTQKALADLDGTGAATAKVRRLVEFGRFLGVSPALLPELARPATPAPAPEPPPSPAAVSAPAAAAAAAPASEPLPAIAPAPVPQPATSITAPTTTAIVAAPAARKPNGREWLKRQPDDAYTLQLFALNHLEKVESLIARYPELDLHLVDYAPAEPRYRVLYGSYRTEEEARAAHATLPEDVRRAQPKAFPRSIREVRADESASPAPVAAATPPSNWLQRQPRERFTLQLFASNSRDNAERVIRRFPDLALALHESLDARSRYRVLYGSFSSPEEARRAFDALPAGLAADAGKPLVKTIGELQDSQLRSAAN